MSATKLVLIVLALIAVLFVVLVVMAPSGDTTNTASNFSPDDHPTLASVYGLLGRFGPKLSATGLTPPMHTFDLSQQPKYDATILPDQSQKFRLASFTVTPSKTCAKVVYLPSNPNDFDKGKRQTSEDSTSTQHPQTFTFTIFSGGGKLKITRSSPVDHSLCVVSLDVGLSLIHI